MDHQGVIIRQFYMVALKFDRTNDFSQTVEHKQYMQVHVTEHKLTRFDLIGWERSAQHNSVTSQLGGGINRIWLHTACEGMTETARNKLLQDTVCK